MLCGNDVALFGGCGGDNLALWWFCGVVRLVWWCDIDCSITPPHSVPSMSFSYCQKFNKHLIYQCSLVFLFFLSIFPYFSSSLSLIIGLSITIVYLFILSSVLSASFVILSLSSYSSSFISHCYSYYLFTISFSSLFIVLFVLLCILSSIPSLLPPPPPPLILFTNVLI